MNTDPLVSSTTLRRELGNVSDMTIWRWTKSGVLPQPVKINKRNYWPASVVDRLKSGNAHPAMRPMGLLYGRDDYQGTQPPAVAVVREPARLLSVRATGRIALVLIEDAGQTRLIRATTCDQPELDVLSPTDRATVAAAVATLHREGGPRDAA